MIRTGIFALATAVVLATTGVATQPSKSPAQPGIKSGFQTPSQTPFFNNPDIRANIKLSDDQFNRLNKAYTDAYGPYQKMLSGLPDTLTDQQRIDRTQQMTRDFYSKFNNTANDVLNPQQRTRFNQLSLQYQGPAAFSDPTVTERLKLTPEQRTKLNELDQQWTKQMNTISDKYRSDPKAASTQFNDLVKTNNERVNAILNDQQQRTWREMIGDPFTFQANAYFQTSQK